MSDPLPEMHEVKALLDRIRQGDQQAARQLYDLLGDPILRLIRRWLKSIPELRSFYDSNDFLQETMWVLYDRMVKECDFTTLPQMIDYLAKVARTQVIAKARKELGWRKRNPDQARNPPLVSADLDALPARDPFPEAVVACRDQLEQVLRDMPPVYQVVLRLLVEGHSVAEVAARLQLGEKNVSRIRRRYGERVGLPEEVGSDS
jgi:RNA polymerase sigma factor (sigma-70 family)